MKQSSRMHGNTKMFPLAVAVLGLVASAAPAASQVASPQSHVRAAEGGAQVRNLNDPSGMPVLAVPAGDILAVFGRKGDWLEVEAPGGFEVWIYGKYVRETNVPGVLRVTGNHVNMRPKPSNELDSFPLAKRLFAGDRVSYLGRFDEAREWSEDWIQVASPPGVRAWVPARETVALESGADGRALWVAAAAEVSARPVVIPASTPTAGQPIVEQKQDALRRLRAADELFSAERRKPVPDLDAVRAAYSSVLVASDTGSTADLARSGIARVDALAEALALQAELEAERVRREAEVERYERELEAAKASERENPYGDRFSCRGWLELVEEKDSAPTYLMRFGGKPVAEIVCSSGRYDLDDFTTFEIGVRGAVLREALDVPEGQTGGVPQSIDVARIEVLSGRSNSR